MTRVHFLRFNGVGVFACKEDPAESGKCNLTWVTVTLNRELYDRLAGKTREVIERAMERGYAWLWELAMLEREPLLEQYAVYPSNAK